MSSSWKTYAMASLWDRRTSWRTSTPAMACKTLGTPATGMCTSTILCAACGILCWSCMASLVPSCRSSRRRALTTGSSATPAPAALPRKAPGRPDLVECLVPSRCPPASSNTSWFAFRLRGFLTVGTSLVWNLASPGALPGSSARCDTPACTSKASRTSSTSSVAAASPSPSARGAGVALATAAGALQLPPAGRASSALLAPMPTAMSSTPSSSEPSPSCSPACSFSSQASRSRSSASWSDTATPFCACSCVPRLPPAQPTPASAGGASSGGLLLPVAGATATASFLATAKSSLSVQWRPSSERSSSMVRN
mmetsp:Transcript_2958/g.9291  ORF Transcript_2958/g.9291 Transcript_2958/m.9291 type:complete len:311 (+) Transcript_2958:282-1214(+)